MYLSTLLAVAVVADAETKTFPSEGITALEVQDHAGNITIKGSNDPQAQVTAKKIKFDEGCRLEIALKGKTLTAIVDRKRELKSGECQVNFDIVVPARLAIHVASGAGDAAITGTKGAIKLTLGAGNVRIDGEVDELKSEVGAGDISVNGMRGSGKVVTGAGNFDLTYAISPSGRLELQTGTGNMRVRLPKESAVKVSFASALGKLRNEFPATDKPSLLIHAQAGTGDLRVSESSSR